LAEDEFMGHVLAAGEVLGLHSITSSGRTRQLWWDLKAGRLGGLEIDDNLELGRLHHR
jgi:hypothetical protein